MSILPQEDRKDLVWSMRMALIESIKSSGVLTEGKIAAAKDFIINEATYEQLLNLAFNPKRETNYKTIEVLEKIALETYAIVLQEFAMPGMIQRAGTKALGYAKAHPRAAAAMAGGTLVGAAALGRATAPKRETVEEAKEDEDHTGKKIAKTAALVGAGIGTGRVASDLYRANKLLKTNPAGSSGISTILKRGGKAALIGAGVAAAGLGAAHALKKRRDAKNK
jgi:hypothetical protein